MAQESVKVQQQQQQQEQRSSWCSLPSDILGEISSRLYAGDYNTFCAVCKAWRSASIIKTMTPTTVVDLLANLFSEEESGSTPLLLQPPASGTMCTIFHPIRNAIYGIQIPELSGAHVHFSDHGWLLLTRDADFSAFFLNPITRQRIELPKPPRRYLFMSFFEPPTSPECVVVGLGVGLSGVTLKFGQGRQEWTKIEFGYISVNYYFIPFMGAPISYEGLIYLLCFEGVVILDVNNLTERGDNVVDVLKSPFSEEELSNMSHSWCEGFIVMDKDEVMVVYALQHWKEFQIFKWDYMKKEWQRMDSLPPNKMLFVSSQGISLLESSTIKGTSNKIYIPMLHQGNTVFYSITTGKYHSFYHTGVGSSSLADDDTFNRGLTRQLHAIWIKPSLAKDKSSALMLKDDFCECPPLITRPVLSISSCSPPPISKARPPHPWLICHGGEHMPNPILYSIRSGTTRIIPMEMQSKSICDSAYGGLVVKEEGATAASNNVQYFVLDVATGQRIQLPSDMHLTDFSWKACLLSASLSDSNCHVIFLDDDEGWMMFCKLGDDGFVKVDYTSIVEGDFQPLMATGRKIYGISISAEDSLSYLCILEILEGSTVRLMVSAQLPREIYPPRISFIEYLIESFGEIFLVVALVPTDSRFEGPAMIDFAIYKVDLDSISNRSSRLECAKVEDIGSQAIFLDDWGTFCSASEPTIKENSIYYLDKHSSMIYVWDLKLRNVTMYYPCAVVDGDCNVSWVMLQEATCSET